MFLIYSADAQVGVGVAAALPAGVQRTVHSTWDAFERASPDAGCLIVHAGRLVSAEVLAGLGRVRARSRRQPIVLVAPADPALLRTLAPLGIDAVLWPGEVSDHLWPTVTRVRVRTLLEEAAGRLDTLCPEIPALCAVLSQALRRPNPVLSVADLAECADTHPASFRRQWRRAFGPDCPVGPADFLDWVLLTHAFGEKRAGRAWADVATTLGVHEHTLARCSQRLLGCGLRDLQAMSRDVFAERLADGLVAPLREGALSVAPALA